MFRTTVPEKLTELMKQGQTYTVAKGEVISSTEDNKNKSLQLVKAGYIKRYQITHSGGVSIQSVYGPNDIFPLTYVFKLLFNKDIYTGPDVFFYEAICDTSLYRLDSKTLIRAIKEDPSLYSDLLMVSAERFQSNIQQLENISLSAYYQRVAHQLWFYANKFSIKKEDSAKIMLPLTQQDLADTLSTTRETVSLCMSQLKKKGLIKSGKFIFIPSVTKLKEEAFY